jgi:hypothetical protein
MKYIKKYEEIDNFTARYYDTFDDEVPNESDQMFEGEKLKHGDFVLFNDRVCKVIQIHSYKKIGNRCRFGIKDILNGEWHHCTSDTKKLDEDELDNYLMLNNAKKYNI